MTDPTTINKSFGKLRAIESELGALFVEREDVVRAMLLALLSREHLALIGPPGTAKSMLIIELAKRVGDSAGSGLRCFVYLLTKFTTPEELFGPVSISGLKADDYRRFTAGKLADVELAFLDETFKASSAILNYLLRLMNEREFENGRQTAQAPLISLFGASNELPQETELVKQLYICIHPDMADAVERLLLQVIRLAHKQLTRIMAQLLDDFVLQLRGRPSIIQLQLLRQPLNEVMRGDGWGTEFQEHIDQDTKVHFLKFDPGNETLVQGRCRSPVSRLIRVGAQGILLWSVALPL